MYSMGSGGGERQQLSRFVYVLYTSLKLLATVTLQQSSTYSGRRTIGQLGEMDISEYLSRMQAGALETK